MNALRSWWKSHGLKVMALGIAVATIVALANVNSAEAKSRRGKSTRGRSSNTVTTPYGRTKSYRPGLQITRQG